MSRATVEIDLPEKILARALVLAKVRHHGDLSLLIVDLLDRELDLQDSLAAVVAWEAEHGEITHEELDRVRRQFLD
ncbi:MAG: hypothetical protein AB7O78_02680 [Thermoleophilia bacterium]